MKKLFSWLNLAGTLVVFGFIWLLGFIGIQFDLLNVFEEVISNYNLTDVYYTRIRDNASIPFEDDIVLVNIGGAELGRRSIANQISIISQHEPAVIGIDAKFFALKEEDPIGDFMLANSIAQAENFVIASEFAVTSDTSTQWDTLYLPPKEFRETAHTAHVNTGNIEFDDFVTWRTIPVAEQARGGAKEVCFAVKVAELFDPEAAEAFLARGKEVEEIYFKGNISKYPKLDVDDVLTENFTPDLIKGKIVLLGYLGDGYNTYYFDEDKFYTPLNEKQVGRGVPDMFGVVVHANVISMILDRNYINDMPAYLGYIIAFILCYLNVALFTAILLNKRTAPYFGLTKLIQLFEIVVIVTVTILTFAKFNYKLDLTLSFFVIILAADITEIFIDIFVVQLRGIRSSRLFKTSRIPKLT